MQTPPSVVFRGIAAPDALAADVRARAMKLARYYPSLITARVLVEATDRRHRAGNRFHVRIDLSVPGRDIVVSHEAAPRIEAIAQRASTVKKDDETDPSHKRLGVAVRQAFDVARRQLQDYARRQRGDVKRHAPAAGPLPPRRAAPGGAAGRSRAGEGTRVGR